MATSAPSSASPAPVRPLLDPASARAFARIFAALFTAILLGWAVAGALSLVPIEHRLGADFSSFWTASQLALAGAPQQAWNPDIHHAAQNALFGRDAGYAAFFYPPPFLLACLPLALLPYGAALAAWIVATGAAWFAAARLWWGKGAGLIVMLVAFPAALGNAGHGQNAFLTAALMGGGLALLPRRPWVAGMLLGALVIKPHLALLIPLALALRGEGRAFAGAAISATALVALSWLAFGTSAWTGFIGDSALARATMENGLVDPAKMQSLFGAVRLAGGGIGPAYAAQAAMTLAAAACVALLALRRADARAQDAALMTATLLATPFLLDYDLVWLSLPLLWLLRSGTDTGFRRGEQGAMLAAFPLPLLSRTIAMQFGIPLAPAVIAILLAMIAARALATAAPTRNPTL